MKTVTTIVSSGTLDYDQVAGWKTRLAQTDWTPWLIVGCAALLRFSLLGIKPPHFDEGINGWFVDQLTKNGFYKYDPTNYHGPLHFYILFLSQGLLGRNLWALRLPVVLVSIACVWLTLRFEPFVGRNVSRLAALAMALSPGFVFYGRYSIHEVWLVLFSMLFVLGLLGLWRFGTVSYLWCAGMGLTGMILTKETYTIHVACALLAIPSVWLLGQLPRLSVSAGKLAKRHRPVSELWRVLAVVFAVCLLLAFCHPWLRTAGPFAWLIPILSTVTVILSVLKKNTRRIGIATGLISLLIIIYLIQSYDGEASVIAFAAILASVSLIAATTIPPKIMLTLGPEVPLPDGKPASQKWDLLDLAVVIAVGAALIVFLYSGTFLHWSGVKGLYQAYAAWFSTGQEGHGHEKPWYYWLKLIARYELPVLIGSILCCFCLFFKNVSLRYLATYGTGTLAAYSIVNYKTPWCIISIVWPFLFLFGAATFSAPLRLSQKDYTTVGAILVACLGLTAYFAIWKHFADVWPYFFIAATAILLFALRTPRAMQAISAIALFASLGSTIWLNYFRCTTETEPYVYVQTYNDIDKLTRPLLALAKRDPIFYQLIGHIIRPSSYPLPWILGDFAHVGYYENKALPQTLDADFLLVESDRIKEIDANLHNSYFTMPLTIRPYQDQSKVYFDAKKFKDYFPKRSPDLIGKGPG